MKNRYICLYSFSKYKRGDEYISSNERDIQKLLKQGMIGPMFAEKAEEGEIEKEKKKENLKIETELKYGSVLQAGQASEGKTAKKSKSTRKKKKNQEDELES